MQKAIEWLDSPEGQKSIDEEVDRFLAKKKISKAREKRIHKLSDEHFNDLMTRLIQRNGDERKNWCRLNGYEAYGTPLLELVFGLARRKGKDVTHKKFWRESTKHFAPFVVEYRGWYFWAIHGQGVHERVYNKDKEVVIHL